VKRVQGLVNRLYVRSLRGSGDIGSWYVHRHRLAMPQYAVGHLERVAAIEARAAVLPAVALAGAAYRGVGCRTACAGTRGRRTACSP